MAYSLEHLGSFPLDSLRIIKRMIDAASEQENFTVDELSQVTAAKGRALSGVLSSFSKRHGRPLVIKAGTIDTDRQGRSYSRPKQLWRLNPLLKNDELYKIREHLAVLLEEKADKNSVASNFVFDYYLPTRSYENTFWEYATNYSSNITYGF